MKTTTKKIETVEEKIAYVESMIDQMDSWECPKLAASFREELQTIIAMAKFDKGELV